ncbi:MAG: tetratricopeptide repeat protein [Chitinophagaceae bacterium]
MKKRNCLIAALLFASLGNTAFSQTIQEGMKSLYYHNYRTAREELQKVVTSRPGDDEAYYYLGLADLGLGDKTAAQADFQKGIQVKANSPLNIVGLGRIDIINHQFDAAKQQFQQAYEITEGRDFNVIRAILEATALSPNIDNQYALGLVAEFKANRRNRKYQLTAEDDVAIGDAYRVSPNGGGEAANKYEDAISADAKDAAAYEKLGALYNDARVYSDAMVNWNDAIAADPNFAPVYHDLYDYYRIRNLDSAESIINKYMALTDDKVNAQQNLVDVLYLQHNYQGAIAKANAIMSQVSPQTQARLYKLIAVSQNAMGDSLDAKTNMDTYFKHQDSDHLSLPFDYELYSEILSKLKQDSLANIYVQKAVNSDTSTNISVIRAHADELRAENNYRGAALYYQKLMNIGKDQAINLDYFWYGFSEFYSGHYGKAAQIFKSMAAKYPEKDDKITAYYWEGKCEALQDTASTGMTGEAVNAFNNYLALIDPNDPKRKDQIILIDGYMGAYYLQKGDDAQALAYADKLRALNPQSPNALAIYINLGIKYYKAKDRTNTTIMFKKVLEMDPNDVTANQILNYYQAVDKNNAARKAAEKKSNGK